MENQENTKNKKNSVMTLTDENFREKVIESAVPVLVDFWAPWCGPCRMIAPIMEEIASDFEGRIKIGKVNVDESPQIASALQVQAIPMLVLFHEGEVKNMAVGLRPKNEIAEMINEQLNEKHKAEV